MRAAVLTVSDGVAEGTRDDRSGRALVERLGTAGFTVVDHQICADGVDGVEAVVIRHARTGRLSAVNAPALYRSTPRRSRDARSAATENESRSVQERGSEPRPSYSLVRGYVRRWN